MADDRNKLDIDQMRLAIRQAFGDSIGTDYTSSYETAKRWNDAFRMELATAIEPALNAHVNTLPQKNLAEMRNVATSTNAAIKQLGFALRCPVSDKASWLIAETNSGERPEPYRYRFQHQDETGRTRRHAPSLQLPHLILMPLPVRNESLARRFYGPGDAPGRI